jgi:hypothetical protein
MGQRTNTMCQRLEAMSEFAKISTTRDGIALLKCIKDLTYNYQSQKYLPHALHESKRRFYVHSQGRHTSTQLYLGQFQNIADVIEHSGGGIGVEPVIESIVAEERNITLDAMTTVNKKDAKQHYLAVAFLLGSNRKRHGKFIESLENDYSQGVINYPKTVTAAYNLLTNWKHDPRNLVRSVCATSDGVSFANVDLEDMDVLSLNSSYRDRTHAQQR